MGRLVAEAAVAAALALTSAATNIWDADRAASIALVPLVVAMKISRPAWAGVNWPGLFPRSTPGAGRRIDFAAKDRPRIVGRGSGFGIGEIGERSHAEDAGGKRGGDRGRGAQHVEYDHRLAGKRLSVQMRGN